MKNRLRWAIRLGIGAILLTLIPFAVQAGALHPKDGDPQLSVANGSAQDDHAFPASVNLGGGLTDLEDEPYRKDRMPVNIVLSGTISIMDYPALGAMVITTTQRFSGTFPTNPYFYPCPNAIDLVFSSTGGACTWDPNTQRIYCPTGITAFTFSYACASIPAVSASNLSVTFISDWGGGGSMDRTWDFAYSPLNYQSASIPPDFDTGQMLRWTQIDEASLTLDIFLTDPRVSLLFLPILYR